MDHHRHSQHFLHQSEDSVEQLGPITPQARVRCLEKLGQAQAANIASIDTGDANCTDEVTFPTGELAGAVCSLLAGRAPQSANGGPGSGSGRWAVVDWG